MVVNDQGKTKKELLAELAMLRDQLAEVRAHVSEFESYRDEYAREGELLKMLRASTPIGLFLVQDSRFIFLNENFRGITGGSPEELLDTDPRKLIFPEDRAMVRESAIAMLKGERTTPYRYRIVMPDGQIRWLLEGVSSVQYQGKRAIFGHSMDITEVERAQEKLEEAYDEERRLRQELEDRTESIVGGPKARLQEAVHEGRQVVRAKIAELLGQTEQTAGQEAPEAAEEA